MATADRMCYVGLGLPAQWWIFCKGYGNAALSISVPKYNVPKQALAMSVLLCGAETWTLLAADILQGAVK